jgi:hypothetical protein
MALATTLAAVAIPRKSNAIISLYLSLFYSLYIADSFFFFFLKEGSGIPIWDIKNTETISRPLLAKTKKWSNPMDLFAPNFCLCSNRSIIMPNICKQIAKSQLY